MPVASLSCVMLGPGTTITHEAVKLAADTRCLLLWVGEHGIRLYSSGMPGGHRCDRLLEQARCALDNEMRLAIVRKMYQYRFNEIFDPSLSIEQLRGKEAHRVKSIYRRLSNEYGVEWNGRRYDVSNWGSADNINRIISTANSCLYGICEAAILIAGYSPSIGFIHYGRPRSFVYDVVDLVKYETVVPLAFKLTSANSFCSESEIRQGCRELFRKERIMERLIPLINQIFDCRAVIQKGVVEPPEFSVAEGDCYFGFDNRECTNAITWPAFPMAI